jgi:hypothetical protein
VANADGLRKSFRAATSARFTHALATVQEQTQAQCPVDTSTLQFSIIAYEIGTTDDRFVGNISTPKEYASYQDQGTGIYGPKGVPIRPVNAKVLAWRSGWEYAYKQTKQASGGWVFAAEVAGSPATHFWSDNVNAQKWLEALTAG